MPTQTEIVNAFGKLADAKKALFAAGERGLARKEDLKRAELDAINSGIIDGKNEMIRKAQLAQATKVSANALVSAEYEKRECQLAFDLASLAADCLKWQVRISMKTEI